MIQSFVLLLLLVDHRLVPPYRRHEVSPRPKVLRYETSLSLAVDPRQVNRTLPLDEPDNLGHRLLRRNRDHHVHMVAHQVPLFDPALLLFGPTAETPPQVPSQLLVQRLAPAPGMMTTWYLHSHFV